MTQDLNFIFSSFWPLTVISIQPAMAEDPQKHLCWVVCAYRKPGLGEEEYHKYMSKVHAPLVKDLMVKYGIIKWSMVVCPNSTILWRLTEP